MSSAGFGGIVLNPKLSHAIIMVMVKITLHTLEPLEHFKLAHRVISCVWSLVYPKISHTVPWG